MLTRTTLGNEQEQGQGAPTRGCGCLPQRLHQARLAVVRVELAHTTSSSSTAPIYAPHLQEEHQSRLIKNCPRAMLQGRQTAMKQEIYDPRTVGSGFYTDVPIFSKPLRNLSHLVRRLELIPALGTRTLSFFLFDAPSFLFSTTSFLMA